MSFLGNLIEKSLTFAIKLFNLSGYSLDILLNQTTKLKKLEAFVVEKFLYLCYNSMYVIFLCGWICLILSQNETLFFRNVEIISFTFY